jgi:hypothetical protein
VSNHIFGNMYSTIAHKMNSMNDLSQEDKGVEESSIWVTESSNSENGKTLI